jgi:hypothetical protein
MGTTSRGAIAATALQAAQPSLLDLYRVEVISGSGARADTRLTRRGSAVDSSL